jgi:fimbrial chaperone protein
MRSSMVRAIVMVFAAVAALHIGARDLAAANFSVNPVQIHLSAKVPTALLTLRNDSTETLRFQLSGFAWDQTSSELIQLTPTSEVIFFPQLLTLGPKEERKIRIGAVAPFGAAEKTFRLFVEELPPLDKPGETKSGVAVLTRVGIPVFMAATTPLAQLEIGDLGLQRGVLGFLVRNTGNTHFMTSKVVVKSLGRAGEVVMERSLTGWYVLGGRSRQYRVDIPAADCSRIASHVVEVTSGGQTVTSRTMTTPAGCTQ